MPAPATFTHVGGLSFSGAREPLNNLWSAVGVEREARLHILDLRPHAFRLDAAAFILGGWRGCCGDPARARTLWALDTPLALPHAAAAALTDEPSPTWEQAVRAVASLSPDETREATGEHSKARRQFELTGTPAPLDSRLYRRTVEGLRLLDELLREGVAVAPQAPGLDAAVTLIEASPALTGRDLNLTGRRPHKPGVAHARTQKLAAYARFDHPAIAAVAATLDAAWDAVLACITAFSVRGDLDQPRKVLVEGSNDDTEGWVYRHPEAVATSTSKYKRQSLESMKGKSRMNTVEYR